MLLLLLLLLLRWRGCSSLELLLLLLWRGRGSPLSPLELLLLGWRGPTLELLLGHLTLELLRRSSLELSLLRDLSLELLLRNLTLELLLLLGLLELPWLGRRRGMSGLELALGNPRLLILLRVDAWRSSVLGGHRRGQEEDGDEVVLEVEHAEAGKTWLTGSSCICRGQ